MNKLDEILIRFSKVNDVIRTKREIIEFFKGCVPENLKDITHGDDEDTRDGWKYCREQILKNIEELK